MILRHALFLLAMFCAPAMAGWVVQNSGTTRTLHSVAAILPSDNEAWACGEGGVILHTTNGGATWITQNSGTSNSLYGIISIETTGDPLVAIGENGTILRTSDKGTTWTRVPGGTTAHLYGVSSFHIHAVGDSGIILRTPDNGLTWVRVPAVTSRRLRSVSTATGGTACGDSGIILRRYNSISDVWSIIPSSTSADLFGIPVFGANEIVVGDSGIILRSSDFGYSWFRQASGTINRLHHAQFSTGDNSRIYCVGDNGTILKSTNDGATWGRQQSGTTRNLNSVFFYLSDNFGWAVGDSGTILRTTDGGGPITDVMNTNLHLPVAVSLEQNYPNPFNPSTRISYQLTAVSFVNLSVFDVLGRQVATLVNEQKSPGTYTVQWSAKGGSARRVESSTSGGDAYNLVSGVYFYRLQAGSFVETKKLILLR